MAKKLSVFNQLRARIINQGTVNLEGMAARIAKNTTYNTEEIYSILRLFVQEVCRALQGGETVKIDRLVSISPNLKLGGQVNLSLRGDRSAIADLNNPTLWSAGKVSNHAHLTKSPEELIALWNQEHPDDPVVE